MAKKKAPPPERPTITADRFRRLQSLLRHLADAPRTRDQLAKALSLDVRGFYRDLEAVRSAGVSITLSEGSYSLDGVLDDALGMLPYPDPRLTLAEVRALAKGRGKIQTRLASQIARLIS